MEGEPMRKTTVLLAVAIVLAGCETAPIKEIQQTFRDVFQGSKGEADLNAGLRSYENGNYNESMKQLQSALDQGLTKSGQLQAHKHLAFIHCASGRQAPCRNEFRKALTIDPAFELTPAEAGHPLWGPVFAKEKARAR
jgi:Tfp pilus assembly protein PilF